MTSNSNKAFEALKSFTTLLLNFDIPKKFKTIAEIIDQINIAREKFKILDDNKVLSEELDISPVFLQKTNEHLQEIFYEKTEKGQGILEEIEVNFKELLEVLQTINQRIAADTTSDLEKGTLLDYYQTCKDVLTFYRVKSKVFKHYFYSPPEKDVDSDPFIHWTDLENQNERILLLTCKLEGITI